ncbi:MAG: hypothetical protein ACRCYY_19205 [Trueperaceae bacterium]
MPCLTLEPQEGLYVCYASPSDPFDANAQPVNAILEIKPYGTYTFTTGAATEDGVFATN